MMPIFSSSTPAASSVPPKKNPPTPWPISPVTNTKVSVSSPPAASPSVAAPGSPVPSPASTASLAPVVGPRSPTSCNPFPPPPPPPPPRPPPPPPPPALLGPSPTAPDPNQRLVAGPSAYVKIADGCNKNCSFCTIPSFKGRQISKTPEAILSELDTLAGRGVREAVLVAQELGSYGVDLPSVDLDLIGLLHAIQEAPGPDWIRLMYLYPSMLTPRLLDTIAASPRICNYIDVPIQHSVPAVLRRMRRPTGSADIANRIHEAREHHPDFAFRTTLIVGFPGETDDDFTDLCGFVENAAFDHLGVFTYSPEDGTPAASLPDQIDPAVRDRRYAAIMEIQQGVALSRRLARVGAEIEVLVEETLPGPTLAGHQSIGRGRAEAPEVDGRVFLDLPLLPGQIVRAEVSGTEPYDLFANVTAAPDGPLKLASEPAVSTEIPA